MLFIDNINTLLGDEIKKSLRSKDKLKISASCFSIYAYEALREELAQIDSLQFLFTSPTFTKDAISDSLPKTHREFFIPKINREKSLYGTEFEIQLKNKLTQKAIAKECADWIRRKAIFKTNKTNALMQQFAIIENNLGKESFSPIDGFTAVSLGYQQGNAISSFIHKCELSDITTTQSYINLFDQIWHDDEKLQDVTETICQQIENVYKENAPEYLYFLIIYQIFSTFLEDINADVLPNDRTGYKDTLIWNKLFDYQKDAVNGIINKLETYNGCILADSVGLGKTFTALAVIKYYELRNRAVLVLCPKKLADNWLTYNRNLTTNLFAKDRFNYDVLCHTDLSRTSGESFGMKLNQVNWGNYDLVVIDESHNFRNSEALRGKETRYQKLMNQVIKSGVKTKVLMLSATPVNNRFMDLRNQLALAYEGHSQNLSKLLKSTRSIEEIFRNAQRAFNEWTKLPAPNRTTKAILDKLDFDFFELLDSVTIARSRKHIQKFYDTKEIGEFPTRLKPISYRCQLTDLDNVDQLNDLLAKLLRSLKLTVYTPINYIFPSQLAKYEDMYDTELSNQKVKFKQSDREKSLVALMSTNLLKRLESSVYAFRLTLEKLLTQYKQNLSAIEAFKKQQTNTEIESAIVYDDQDEDLPSSIEIGDKIKIKLADMDITSWEQELRVDLVIIEEMLMSVGQITEKYDYKLQHLANKVLEKTQHPINPNNKKIIIFTAFADTAHYLYQHLAPLVKQQMGLHTALVTGSDNPQSTLQPNYRRQHYDLQEILTLFSPMSKSKSAVLPQENAEIDLLIATDCISEGQNLQDCDYLINYDIHWNPVRIIQRFGRIDRIGSPNEQIQLVNYWPDVDLDEYINLKERVEKKMTIVDMTATGDDNLLSQHNDEMAYRKEQLKRLQEEVIDLEDVKTGVSIMDLGLNEFRMDLLNFIQQYGEPTTAPTGLHAVVPTNNELNLQAGIIFALKHINATTPLDQQNRLHPYYLVYIGNNGEIITNHLEIKAMLDLLRSCCKGKNKPITQVCNIFNRLTKDGQKMQHCSELLNQAIHSMVETKEQKDVLSLFSEGETTALTNQIKGLEDFELIAFIVIQEENA
ncbi:superfamily II DNA/RNA helicase, SNF2 family, ATP-dependent [Canicola haemoglobinophilus]|uniref:Superfamily II DNA/RNA helicase, SNF2 family, ATP-dependent n=1 Tax=Canicola haemoglobinophilus TaxID=733 RepID=A0AB38H9G6_9PAST|nr:helicase-related protein [Canicola haemoglobinophilus]STO54222.1 superfamily II DNA/RNA helicase, SNF2 family, ATP-dependent [Canicola haemoglobinophilus]STO68755.1 superfamily II DNA/RNA helicase, SNF2 family, ATP-dependent [Canicola haemoglobinophilus]